MGIKGIFILGGGGWETVVTLKHFPEQVMLYNAVLSARHNKHPAFGHLLSQANAPGCRAYKSGHLASLSSNPVWSWFVFTLSHLSHCEFLSPCPEFLPLSDHFWIWSLPNSWVLAYLAHPPPFCSTVKHGPDWCPVNKSWPRAPEEGGAVLC